MKFGRKSLASNNSNHQKKRLFMAINSFRRIESRNFATKCSVANTSQSQQRRMKIVANKS
jgi:hypothetical protein